MTITCKNGDEFGLLETVISKDKQRYNEKELKLTKKVKVTIKLKKLLD